MAGTLLLYSAPFCSLCEKAKLEIWPALSATGYSLQEVCIIDDDDLLERYQFSIPVIKVEGTERELGWPFDASAVLALIQG